MDGYDTGGGGQMFVDGLLAAASMAENMRRNQVTISWIEYSKKLELRLAETEHMVNDERDKNERLRARIAELEQANAKLQGHVDHYRERLKETSSQYLRTSCELDLVLEKVQVAAQTQSYQPFDREAANEFVRDRVEQFERSGAIVYEREGGCELPYDNPLLTGEVWNTLRQQSIMTVAASAMFDQLASEVRAACSYPVGAAPAAQARVDYVVGKIEDFRQSGAVTFKYEPGSFRATPGLSILLGKLKEQAIETVAAASRYELLVKEIGVASQPGGQTLDSAEARDQYVLRRIAAFEASGAQTYAPDYATYPNLTQLLSKATG